MTESDLAKALAVTAELTGTDLSEAAARVMVSELAAYDRRQVAAALKRCRRELKGRLTIAAVLERLDDGRPGPEEAWAMLPTNEDQSVVWTEEMAKCFGIVGPLIAAGDKIAARMAFREAYQAEVAKARDARLPAKWTASLGHSVAGRESAVLDALGKGRITPAEAADYLPPVYKKLGLTDGSVLQRD